jgi:DNA-directed RNA polymerase specialized sigma24 family protein
MPPETPCHAPFEITRWSLITRAREENSVVRRRALGDLCAMYWYPLYAFLRCSGRSVEDSEDLVQDFLARLTDGSLLAGATPSNGKFRSLLLASLKNVESNARRIAHAQKRGGGVETISLDIAMAEQAWQADPRQDSPDRTFDRAWARTVIAEAAAALKSEYAASGKTELFAALFPRLNGVRAAESLAELGSNHGMTEAAMKMAFSRMKARYADALRTQISQTVGSRQDAEEEFRHLLSVFAQ